MTTGTGLALLGVWIAVAACWHSTEVPGATAILASIVAIVITIYLS